MKKIPRLRISPKILIIPVIGVLIVAAVFFSIQSGGGENTLSDAIEGGEFALASVGRNYESLIHFVQNNETQARQLLDAARVALENARAKFSSARRTDDEYVLGMLDNYQRVSQASDVMARGNDNLLVINENLTSAISFYSQGDYEQASEQASYCLQVLTPLLEDFEESSVALNGTNVIYVPSGQRDRLTLGVGQYRNEMEIYNQYVLLLRSLMQGRDYLAMNAQLEEQMRQLQSALANGDYETAQRLREEISQILQSLRDPRYQSAADLASQLNPNLLRGTASDVARELRNRLRDLEGIAAFEDYLQGLERYSEALRLLEQGDREGAEQAMNEGLGILGQGQRGDQELQGLYTGLREAFNTLEMRIKGQPEQG